MRIAAFDFDGTILFGDDIPADTITAIRAWQDAGHLAVAATGKSRSAAQFALRGFDVAFDYSVLFTGAVVTDRTDTVLHSTALDVELVRSIVAELSDTPGLAVYGTTLESNDARFLSTLPPTMSTSILRDFREVAVHEVTGEQFIGVPIWVPEDRELRLRIHDWVQQNFDVDVFLNQTFIDILPRGASKGTGLQWLIEHLGVSRDDVELITFGDSWNDLSMHAIADRSYSFTWSPDDVKADTHATIDTVAEGLLTHLNH